MHILKPGQSLFIHPETHEIDLISDFCADIKISQAKAGGYIEMENESYIDSSFDDPECEEAVAINTDKLIADLQGKRGEEAIKIINPNYEKTNFGVNED